MNKLLLFFIAFVAMIGMRANASDTCVILFNKKVIFKGEVDKTDAVAFLKSNSFKKTDCLLIKYVSENELKGWKRTFYFDTEQDENVTTLELKKQSGSVYVNASLLDKMKEKKQPVIIYTMSLPTDKAMAARIRVRRIFICKIEWN